MKANELRIGNWVLLNKDQEIQIDSYDIEYISKNIDDGFYEPISLTEKWLEEFGFDMSHAWKKLKIDMRVDGNESISYSNGAVILNQDNGDDTMPFGVAVAFYNQSPDENRDWETFPDKKNSIVLRDCRYVHQIQNLYFALKGEELTLTK